MIEQLSGVVSAHVRKLLRSKRQGYEGATPGDRTLPDCAESLRRPTCDNSCSAIIDIQGALSWESFQVPEPWSGRLLTTPILFLSSNPSISGTEAYPQDSPAEPSFGGLLRCPVRRILDPGQPRTKRRWHLWPKGKLLVQRFRIAPGNCSIETQSLTWTTLSPRSYIAGRKVKPEWDRLLTSALTGRRDRRMVYLAHPGGPEPKPFKHWVSATRMQEIREILRSNA